MRPTKLGSLFSSRSLLQLLLLSLACAAAPASSFGQAFVAAWDNLAGGGVSPTGMALATESGTAFLYVSDHPRGRILKLNATTGAVVATIGAPGSGNLQFNQPYGIAIDPASGDLYVAERGNNRVQRITNAGAFVTAFGTAGSAAGQLNQPIGVAVDASGDIYVTEHDNHRVQRFHLTGSGTTWTAASVGMWGSLGTGNGQFNIPYAVALDSAGNVLVADGLNGRVQRFSATGTYQSTFGATGLAAGQFIVPTGLALDATGNIYVSSTNLDPQNGTATDAASQWISKFSATGTFVSRFGGGWGTANGQFKLPFSIVLGPNNRAFVADYYNNRIQVFDLAQAPSTPAPAVATFASGASTATSVTFNLTFNQAVTGVDTTDFTATATGTATATLGTVTGSGATYAVPVVFTGTGTIQLTLKSTGTGITGTDSVALTTGGTSNTFTIPSTSGGTDTTAPTVASFTIASSNATSVTYKVTFSEAVTGVDKADFTATTTGGATATLGTVTGSGTTYEIPITLTGTGTVQLKLNPTGTGIADAANNAFTAGATGPTHVIGGSSSGGSDVKVASVTVPANGRYEKNDVLLFTVKFSAAITVASADRSGDDDDDDDASVYFTWTAVGGGDSGKVVYVSGSGTDTLTFRLKVHNGDVAPTGIRLGTTLLMDGARLADTAGRTLSASALALTWPTNPLTGVVLDAAKSNRGKGHPRDPEDRLANISSRLRVIGHDANRSVIAGFVIDGTAAKSVLIRAIGPGLAKYGIRDALDAPRLEVRNSKGELIAGNDGWGNSGTVDIVSERVGAFRLDHGSRDAALVANLAPGLYTVQVTANGNGTVLVEVYDASSGTQLTTDHVMNISTRGFVDKDEGELIAGFVIAGRTPKRVLIRGVGPGLAPYGVKDLLADPQLKLFAAGTATPVAQNDNWGTPVSASSAFPAATAAEITAAAQATGAFALSAGSKDAVLLVTLPPGNYTAILSGADGGTGAGMVEVYEVTEP